MTKSLTQFSPKKQCLLNTGKAAFLQYVADRKQSLHNYQRRSIFWDREHLYSENLMLRNKIKYLAQNNTKTKTQLLKSQKEMMDLTMKNKSNQNFCSLSKSNFSKDRDLSTPRWRIENPQDETYTKQYLQMKKSIRRLKDDIDRLKAENVELKKSIKYTRMNEIQIENMQLQEEMIRMKKITSHSVLMYDQLQRMYKNSKEDLEYRLRKEQQTKAQLCRELKKIKSELDQANIKLKSQRSNKKLLEQINFLKRENNQLKDVLEVNMKNNSQLKETLQSYIKNLHPRQTQANNQYVTKLDYSASVISVCPDSPIRAYESPAKMPYNSLTSHELLMPTTSLQLVRTAQKTLNSKMNQKINQDPQNEEQQDKRPLQSLQQTKQKHLKQKKKDGKAEQNYLLDFQQIPVKEKEYEQEFQQMVEEEI